MNQTGSPIMKALVLNYQDDENVYEIGDQYLFGDNLMICPVTIKGAQTRTVYLPEGDWYDWWTGKKYSGKQYIHVVTPLDTSPILAKAGAIIPMQPAMKYVGEKPVDVITLDVFPSANSSFNLYEDDGQSLKYQQDDYSITKIKATASSKQFNLQIERPQGNFVPPKHGYLLKVHVHNGLTPKRVYENGTEIKNWTYDEREEVVHIRTINDNTKNIDLHLSY